MNKLLFDYLILLSLFVVLTKLLHYALGGTQVDLGTLAVGAFVYVWSRHETLKDKP
jgi:hypothetical protein